MRFWVAFGIVLLVWEGIKAQDVQAVQNLSFGSHLSGNTVEISYSDGRAAAYQITNGSANGQVEVSFSLPADLSDADGDTQAISFGPNSAAYNNEENVTGANSFDPNTTQTLTLSGSGELYIWIGASVDISEFQSPGDYTSDIILNVNPL